jgi:hypothetical protein
MISTDSDGTAAQGAKAMMVLRAAAIVAVAVGMFFWLVP